MWILKLINTDIFFKELIPNYWLDIKYTIHIGNAPYVSLV